MYRYELHMHTSEGSACAFSTIDEMIKRYKDLGFTGAAVTNHFYCGNTCVDRNLPWCDFVNEYARAYYEGQNAAAKLDFDLLFGMEENYAPGKEILVYGIEPQFLIDRPQLKKAPIEVWSREVRETGGFIAYSHPFRDRPYIKNPKEMPDLTLVDGIEVYNRCNRPSENDEAEEAFKNTSLAYLAGSDWHRADFTDAFGVYLPERARTSAELAEFLHKREYRLAVPFVEK